MTYFTRPLMVTATVMAIALAPTTAWATTDPTDAAAGDAAGAVAATPTEDVTTTATATPTPAPEPQALPTSDAPVAATPAEEPAPVPNPDGSTQTVDPVADVPPAPAEAEEEPGGDGGHEGEGGTLPAGVVVTVDGRDITASDPAGSLPMIAGCSFDVTATGLQTTPPDVVGVTIKAWPPTATEENRPVLVNVTESSANGSWAGVFALDDAVQQFDRSPNGYHMRLEFFLNGVKSAMKMYWLGCGQPQTGDPRRMLFDVEWLTHSGTAISGDLDRVLPAGWRQGFRLAATGDRGTVGCRYLTGSDVLSCLYDNPGHGTEPGLVLPGEPGTSYRVSTTGVPRGWTVDATTVGEFLADDTCPKGGGHEGEEASEAPREPCLHVVSVVGPLVDNVDEGSGGGSAQPPADEGANAAAPAPAPAAAPQLAATGANGIQPPALALGAFVLLMLGAALVALTRRESGETRCDPGREVCN